MTTQRKFLSILQPVNSERINMRSAPVKPVVVKGDENANVSASRKKIGSVDALKPVKRCDASSQTDITCDGIVEDSNDADLADQLTTNDELSSEYWKILAERRREALAEALTENEKLHKLNEQLLEDNARLLELANQADYFANMLKEVTEETEEHN